MKLIINARHGGFGFPPQIMEMYLHQKGIEHFWYQLEGRIDCTKPYRYVRKKFEDLDLKEFLRGPIPHIKYLGPEVSVYDDFEGCISWDEWDSTRIIFFDSTKEYDREGKGSLRIDARIDPKLIEIVEGLSPGLIENMRSLYNPRVVEIPDDVEWTIEAYDGYEWVAEKHRTWEA